MKRDQGEGTIRHRADGRWEARVSLRLDDGRVRRRSVYARTKTEARERMQELLREVARGLPVPDERMTVDGYLRQWLRDVEGSVRPLTIAAYRRWLSPAIGRRCKYEPSCSVYAATAIRRFGPLRGGLPAAFRF